MNKKINSLVVSCVLVFIGAIFFASPNSALAAAPSILNAVLQNSTPSSVDLYITGTSFNSFVHTTGYVADATDLANITYNSLHPTSATIVEVGITKHLTATFAIPTASTSKSGGSLTIAANTIKNSTTMNLLLTLTDENITDAAAPILAEVTPITDPTSDATPDYTFTSSEAGTISYGGDCISSDTSADAGSNTITFNVLASGSHTNCTITVEDADLNTSSTLDVSDFVVDSSNYLGRYWNQVDLIPPAVMPPVGAPDFTRSDASINFNWGGGSPDGSIGNDYFAAEWTKTIVSTGNDYTFSVTNLDDGVRVYVDDELVIDAWGTHNGDSVSGNATLSAGTHTLRVDYYEDWGGASITLSYSTITAPVLEVVTPVPESISSSALIEFTFSSDHEGPMSVGGSCTSVSSYATVGDNTITLDQNELGLYDDCTVTVATAGTELATVLDIPSFTIVDAASDIYVDDDYTSEGDNDGYTWGVTAFDSVVQGVEAAATGATVHVAPGTYISNQDISIDKSITLTGPGKDSETPATIINNDCSYAISIYTSTSTVSGLLIKQTENDNETLCHNLPVIRVLNDGSITTGTVISDNDIAGGRRGLQLRGDSQSATITGNDIHDSSDGGISLASSKHNTIQDNHVSDNDGYGIYLWSGDCSDYCDGNPSDNLISNNVIHDNSESGIYAENGTDNRYEDNTVYNNYKHGIAIKTSDVQAGHESIIRGNTVYDNGLMADTHGYGPAGIEVQADYTKVLDNVVTNNERNGIMIGGSGFATNNVSILGNTIGFAMIDGGLHDPNVVNGIYVLDGTGIEIHNNNILGEVAPDRYGVYSTSGSVVDATSNWWGDVSGPFHTDTNSEATGSRVSDNVNYDPFLLASIDTGGVDLYVDDDYVGEGENEGHTWGVDAFDNISDALLKATASSTIHVATGTYIDDQPMEITTPGITITGPGRDSETPATVIDNGCNSVFSVQADDVTISGFILKQTQEDAETYCSSSATVRVSSTDKGDGDSHTYTHRVLITDNEIAGGYTGLALRGDSASSTVSNNLFHNQEYGISLPSSKHNIITGNTIRDIGTDGIEFWDGECNEYFCDGNPNNNEISENIIHDIARNGIALYFGYDNTIRNNTVYSSYFNGIYIGSSEGVPEDHGNIVEDNTVYDNGLEVDSDSNNPSGIDVQADYTQVLNNTITHNRRNGIKVGGDATANFVTITGNTIGTTTIDVTDYEGNTERGIYVLNGEGHEIHNNNIIGNGDWGIFNDSGTEVDARNNWWGDVSGPEQNDTNPEGLGNPVSADVLYDPYLDSEIEDSSLRATIVSPADEGSTQMATPLIVMTDHDATCEFAVDEESAEPMNVTGETVHTDNLVGLDPGPHTVRFNCESESFGDDSAVSTWTKIDPGNVVLYGVDAATGRLNPHLFTIDPETGSKVDDIGPTGHDLSGLAISPTTGIMYGTSGGKDEEGGNPHSLFTINKVTGEATLLGLVVDSEDEEQNMADIAFSSDGTLYGWGEPSADSIFTIDIGSCDGVTCNATIVGESELGTYGSGMTITSDNRVFQFGQGEDEFYEIDRTDGSVISTTSFLNRLWGSPGGHALAAATADPTDMIFVAGLNGGFDGAELMVVDTENGISVSMGGENEDMRYMDALAFDRTRILYVDDDYTSDGGNGGHTWGVDAFDNISDALAAAQDGNIINVADGDYVASHELVIDKSISLVGPGIDGEEAATLSVDGCDYVMSLLASYINVSGFYMNSATECPAPAVRVLGEQSTDSHTQIHDVTITHNNISGGNRGVILRGDSRHNTVSYNVIHGSNVGINLPSSKENTITYNTITDTDDGIDLEYGGCGEYCDGRPDDNIIANNSIHDNTSNGIFVEHGFRNNISHNTVYNNGRNGIAVHSTGEEITSEDANTIDSNTVYHNGHDTDTDGPGPTGIDAGADYTSVTNNIVADNVHTGIKIGGGDFSPVHVTVEDNTVGTSTISETEYDGNQYGIYIYSGHDHEIHHNVISGNEVGMYNNSASKVDATDNYWGTSTGPTHTTNPNGTGDSLADVNDAFLINYRPFSTNSDFSTDSAVSVSSSGLSTLFSNGGSLSIPSEESLDSASQISVDEDTEIEIPVNNGTSTISLTAGTVITKTTEGSIDATQLIAEDIATSSISGLAHGVVAKGALKWGIVDLGLSFSSPITISVFVGSSLNGRTLDVYRSVGGTGDWTQDGIEDPRTCTVSSGLCTFQATRASFYAVTGTGSGGSTRSNSSGSGSSSNYGCTDPNALNYKQFATSKPSLCQYSDSGGASTTPSSTSSYRYIFTRNLEKTMTGDDVRELQKFLNANGFVVTVSGPGSPGSETTLFGELTRMALVRFQAAHGISPAVGFMGPITMAFINNMNSMILMPAPSIDPIATPLPTTTVTPDTSAPAQPSTYNRDLDLGMSGDDVMQLQLFLIGQATGPAAKALEANTATGFFGPLTRDALKEYQKAKNITPALGFFGPVTRTFVSQ